MVDYGFRIGLAELDAGLVQYLFVGFPRGVQVLVWQVLQFRAESPHIGAGLVELAALADRVEDPEIGRRIGA